MSASPEPPCARNTEPTAGAHVIPEALDVALSGAAIAKQLAKFAPRAASLSVACTPRSAKWVNRVPRNGTLRKIATNKKPGRFCPGFICSVLRGERPQRGHFGAAAAGADGMFERAFSSSVVVAFGLLWFPWICRREARFPRQSISASMLRSSISLRSVS